MSKIAKSLLLAACAGMCAIVFWVVAGFVTSKTPLNFYRHLLEFAGWQGAYTLFGFFLLGLIPCLIFGTPVLLIIERNFSSFKTRYITGGFFAGWVAWFFMVGPLLTKSPWLSVDSWVDSGINYVGIYVSLGFCTGTLLTSLLWIFERSKGKLK